MRILFVTDSLGAPRPNVPWKFTYPAILQSKLGSSHNSFCYETRRGSTTNCLRNPDLLESYQPDIAIVQLGIVDCIPRLFTQLENIILQRLPCGIRSLLIRICKCLRRRSLKRAYVKPEDCKKNWQIFLRKTAETNCQVIIIPVATPGKIFSVANSGATEAIKQYNILIRSLVPDFPHITVLPDWESVTDEYEDLFLPEDGYHLSISGHRVMAHSLLPILEKNNSAGD